MNKGILPIEAKVGLFLAVTTLILFFVSFNVGKFGSIKDGGTNYIVQLPEAHGLIKDTVVEMDGVRVGKILNVNSDASKGVWVEFVVEGPQRVHEEAIVAVRASGLLGGRYVTVTRGDQNLPLIPEGGEIIKKERSVDVDEILQRVSGGVDDLIVTIGGLKEVLADQTVQQDLKETVHSIRAASANLDKVLADFSKASPGISRDLGPLISDLRSSASDLKVLTARANDWSLPLTAEINERLAEVADMIESIKNGASEVSDTVFAVRDGEGTIPMLINDREVAENIADTISGVKDVVDSYSRFHTYFGYRGEFQYHRSVDNAIGFKHWITIDLAPSDTLWYTAQIISDPEGFATVKTVTTDRLDEFGQTVSSSAYRETTVEDKLAYSLFINKRFGDLGVRIGLMESAGGWGLTYNFLGDKLKVDMDVYNFGREDNFPIVRNRISWNWARYLQFSASISDWLNTTREPVFAAGGAFYFNDEDLKMLLLGSPTLPE